MMVKCIKSTGIFLKGDKFNAQVDKGDIFNYKISTVNSAIIELYYKDYTIAQTMYRFYRKSPVTCWDFDSYFKEHFQIINE